MPLRLRRLAQGALLAVLAACAWSAVLVYSRNTPFHHPEWIVLKRMKHVELLGGSATTVTRMIFAQGILHTNAWFGFQEVRTARRYHPREMRFRARFGEGATLAAYLADAHGNEFGVRLRTVRPEKSSLFAADAEGRFTANHVLPLTSAALATGRWHDVAFDLSGGGKAIVSLDGHALGELSVPGEELQIGFRGSYFDADVKDVRITGADGSVSEPGFLFWTGFARTFLFNLALFGVLGLALSRLNAAAATGLLAAAAVCGAMFFGFDFYYWSSLPFSGLNRPVPDNWKFTRQLAALDQLEKLRFAATGTWNRLATGAAAAELARIPELGYPPEADIVRWGPIYCGPDRRESCRPWPRGAGLGVPCPAPGPGRVRLLFVGTSQTFGSGADTLDQTFFVRTVRKVQAALPKSRVDAVNMAVIAGLLDPLWEDYKTQVALCRPDLVVVDLGNNDNPDTFRARLGDMLALNRSAGVPALLLLEANANRVTVSPAREKHGIMKELGASYGVPVLDLNAFITDASLEQAGFYWWDGVHLSSFAQGLVADWLAPQALRELSAARKR